MRWKRLTFWFSFKLNIQISGNDDRIFFGDSKEPFSSSSSSTSGSVNPGVEPSGELRRLLLPDGAPEGGALVRLQMRSHHPNGSSTDRRKLFRGIFGLRIGVSGVRDHDLGQDGAFVAELIPSSLGFVVEDESVDFRDGMPRDDADATSRKKDLAISGQRRPSSFGSAVFTDHVRLIP